MSKKKILDPTVAAKLDKFDLRARLIVEGFLTGLHKSPYHGFSVEFLEHREYQPGDSIKDLDWKVYGKTDKYFIKKYEEETNLKAYILIDCSKSMQFSTQAVDKLDYAKTLAAALSYLLVTQQDAVGIMSFADKIKKYIPPRASRAHLNTVFHQLDKLQADNETNTAEVLHKLAERIKKRGLIILISDMLDDEESIMKGLQHFRHNKHELLVFHIMDKQEMDFDYHAKTRFVDMESGEEIITNPWEIKKEYLKKIESMQKFFSTKCKNAHIDYVPINTKTNYDKALYSYLIKRKKMV
ncbi:MAG: DUF58 domain-containing protein [Candidatus Cloacimonetes bacterium]|nr:DUF58 domain-containing protein [Candidatus Cloacimonadota bacterium]MBS3768161.1 DUF58 domain-containing protein [Candidatus Cloacimonadota bacterium]